PDYVAGVWVGNDDDKPMNQVTGGEIAAAIWRDFMVTAHAGLPAREFDWLLPDPVPTYVDDPRNAFFEGLAQDFSDTVAALEPAPMALPPLMPLPAPLPAPEPGSATMEPIPN
ncbi:MAG TPA: hypothetical protein VM471_07155, partial [Phenylobacterium sp.]|nr:hypothetical protein [Phenylobacterium sp.]